MAEAASLQSRVGTALLVLSLPVWSCPSLADDSRTLEQLLARNSDARGGREKLEAVKSLEIELRLSEPGFGADLLYRSMRPFLARVDVMIEGEVVFTEAYDGSSAWQRSGEGSAEDLSAEGTVALRNGAIGNLYPLQALPDLGYGIEALERTEIDGVLFHTLKVTATDGSVRHSYLDPETFLVTRERSEHALHPDVDPEARWLETRKSDFRTVDGIVRSFRSTTVDLNTGEEIQSIELKEVRVNPVIDPAIFRKPRGTSDANERPTDPTSPSSSAPESPAAGCSPTAAC